jgi:hypothetical protein
LQCIEYYKHYTRARFELAIFCSVNRIFPDRSGSFRIVPDRSGSFLIFFLFSHRSFDTLQLGRKREGEEEKEEIGRSARDGRRRRKKRRGNRATGVAPKRPWPGRSFEPGPSERVVEACRRFYERPCHAVDASGTRRRRAVDGSIAARLGRCDDRGAGVDFAQYSNSTELDEFFTYVHKQWTSLMKKMTKFDLERYQQNFIQQL